MGSQFFEKKLLMKRWKKSLKYMRIGFSLKQHLTKRWEKEDTKIADEKVFFNFNKSKNAEIQREN